MKPRDFSPFVAAEIVDRVSEGQTIRNICALETMPSYPTLRRWLRKYPEFRAEYEAAMVDSAELIVAEELDVAREAAERRDLTAAEVAGRKLLSESLRWHARVRNPNRYSEKTAIDHNVRIGRLEKLTDAELVAIAAGGGGPTGRLIDGGAGSGQPAALPAAAAPVPR